MMTTTQAHQVRTHSPVAVRQAGVLTAIGAELSDIEGALLVGVRFGNSKAMQTAVRRLQGQLFLSASQLMPLWRDLCHDGQVVDRAEVRLAHLRFQVDEILMRHAEDPLQPARCAVLAEELHRHRSHSAAWLSALETGASPATMDALGDIWQAETKRMLMTWRAGAMPVMDNEADDPVGPAAHCFAGT